MRPMSMVPRQWRRTTPYNESRGWGDDGGLAGALTLQPASITLATNIENILADDTMYDPDSKFTELRAIINFGP